ncbi:MAG TPA: hypothetical protein GX717_08775, partial [Clostridiaceae bacterium]|nr:hypothetical protein [Clostridiaceae bacterium]
SNGHFCIRYREVGSIHDVAGMSAFAPRNDIAVFDQSDSSRSHRSVAGKTIEVSSRLCYILGLMGLKLSDYILLMLNPTINMQVGDFVRFPVLIPAQPDWVIAVVRENIQLAKLDWDSLETSWNFQFNPLVSIHTYLEKYRDIIGEGEACSEEMCDRNQLSEYYAAYKTLANHLFDRLLRNEQELNQFFLFLSMV